MCSEKDNLIQVAPLEKKIRDNFLNISFYENYPDKSFRKIGVDISKTFRRRNRMIEQFRFILMEIFRNIKCFRLSKSIIDNSGGVTVFVESKLTENLLLTESFQSSKTAYVCSLREIILVLQMT